MKFKQYFPSFSFSSSFLLINNNNNFISRELYKVLKTKQNRGKENKLIIELQLLSVFILFLLSLARDVLPGGDRSPEDQIPGSRIIIYRFLCHYEEKQET